MIDKIINGIVNRIRQKYDESKYEIYTESVEQGLKEPCFSILCLSPHIEHIVGTRYKRTLSVYHTILVLIVKKHMQMN